MGLWGNTALHIAARKCERADMCGALLKNGANVNAQNRLKKTPLTVAALNDSAECVKILSEKAADLRGALEFAEKNEEPETIKILKWSQKMHSLKIRKFPRGKSKLWSITL